MGIWRESRILKSRLSGLLSSSIEKLSSLVAFLCSCLFDKGNFLTLDRITDRAIGFPSSISEARFIEDSDESVLLELTGEVWDPLVG